MSNFSANSDWFKNYVNSIEVEEFNKNRPKLTYKKFEENQTLSTYIAEERFLNTLEKSTDLVPEYDYMDRLKDKQENLLGLYRMNFSEIEERDAKRQAEREKYAALITDEEKELHDITEGNKVAKIKEGMKNNVPLWQLMNPDDFVTKEAGEAQVRLYDTTDGYSMSQYTTFTTADTYKSWFGTTKRVRMGAAQRLQLDTSTADVFRKIAQAAGIQFNFEGEVIKGSNLTIKQYIDEHIGENPDQYWFWENIKDIFVDTGIDGRLGPWNSTMLSEKLLALKDDNWMGEGGDRDKLIAILSMDESEIGPTGAVQGEVRQFLAENPQILEDLKGSQNGWQFISALNARKSERVIGNYLTENNGDYGSAGFLNLLGYGFTTDPALALDVAATVGLTAVTGGGYLGARVGAGVLQVGTKMKFAVNALDHSKKLRHFNKMVDLAKKDNVLRRYSVGSKLAKGLSRTGEGIMFTRRLLPTQIVSELFFPSVKFLWHGRAMKKGDDAVDAGKSWWKYLKDENYLGDNVGHRMLHRALGGAMEGVVWGSIEYGVMEDYQDRTNSLIFGNEASAALALDRDRSGAFGHMLMFGVAFGGLGGPLIGEAFTQLGRIPKGLIKGGMGLNQWADQLLSPGGQEAMGYTKTPWAKRFAAKVVKGTGVAAQWLGGGNQYTIEQHYLMYKALSMLSDVEIEAIKADESGRAMTKTLQSIQDRISKWHFVAEEGGLDLKKSFENAEAEFMRLDPSERTARAFTDLVENDIAAQEHVFREGEGFRDRVSHEMRREHDARMRASSDFDLMQEAMAKADPSKPPAGSDGVTFSKEAEEIEAKRVETARQNTEARAEQARREAGEDLEEPVATPDDIKGDLADEMALRDADTIAAKQQAIEDAKKLQKEAEQRIAEMEGGSKQEKKANYPEEYPAAKKQIRDAKNAKKKAEEFLEKAEKAKEIPLETVEEELKAKLEEAENDVRNISDEKLADRITDFELTLGQLRSELNSEAMLYWQQNPTKFVEMVGWFRKTVLNERMRGDTPNANNLPPMITGIKELEPGQWTHMVELFAPGVYFSRDELLRIIPNIKNKVDREFLEAALVWNQNSRNDIDLDQAGALKLAKEMEEILLDHGASKDYTLEEMHFMNRIINNPNEETILKAFKETRIDTYVNSIMIDAAKRNKTVSVKDLLIYNQDPELVTETFAKARLELGELMAQVKEGNYESILKSQGKHVLNSLGEGVQGFKKSKTNQWKAEFLADHFENSPEFTNSLREMLDVFDDVEGQVKTPKQLTLVKNKVQDLLEKVANDNKRKLQLAEIRRLKKENNYSELRTEMQDAYASWDKAAKEGTNSAKINKLRSEFIKKKNAVKRLNEGFKKSVEANWESIKQKWVDMQGKRLDIETRPDYAHTRPLIKIVSMLNGHLLATSKWWHDPVTGFHVDSTISRKDLISILESAEEGYGFIANLDDIAIGSKNGSGYDGDKVVQALIERIKTSNETLGEILRQGFEKNRDIHFGKKLPYAKDVYGSGGDLRNLMESLKGQQAGKQAYAREKGQNGEYSGNRLEGNLTRDAWVQAFNGDLLNGISFMLKGDGPRSQRIKAAVDSLRGQERVDRLLDLVNEFIPEGQEKLRDFSQLGGGTDAVDWVGPKRAANAVLSALSSDRPYANKVAEAEVILGQKGPAVARRLGAINEDGIFIQHDSDPVIQRNFERASADQAMNWLLGKLDDPELDAAGRKDIYDKLEAWLQDFPEQAFLNEAVRSALPRQGLSFVPRWMVAGPDLDIIGKNFGEGIAGQIKYQQAMNAAVTPALMATIHDAIFVGLPTMMTKFNNEAAASPNWNYKDSEGRHVLRGIGFGFQTMIARQGTFEDAINLSHELIYGYTGLVDNARKAYNKMSRQKIENLTEQQFKDNDEFMGWMVQEFPKLNDENKKAIVREIFPAVASSYMDADSSGSNIMLAIVMGQKADFGSLWEKIKGSAPELEQGAFNEAHSTAVNNAYKHVENYIVQRINDGNFEGKVGLEEVYADLKGLFEFAQAEGATKAILKGPVMTDSYGVGVKSMAKQIRDSLGAEEIREKLIRANKGFTTENYDVKIHALSDSLATLLSKGIDDNLGGWIKRSLFEQKITNKKLGGILSDWRNTNSGAKVRTAGDKESLSVSNARMDSIQGVAETNAGYKAGNREETLDFDDMFTEVRERVETLAEIMGDANEAKEWVSGIVNLMVDDLKGNKNIQKLIDEGKYAEAQEAIDIQFNTLANENITVKALNSYMAQGIGYDEAGFKSQIRGIIPDADADKLDAILGNLNPITRQAIKGQMFRQLAISAETRNFVSSNFDLIADKILRLEAEESPLGLAKLIMEPLGEEDIRQRTILQAMKEISEIYDLEKLGLKVGGEEFKNLTWDQYFKQWEKDSDMGQELRLKAIESLQNINWKAMLNEIDEKMANDPSDEKVMSLEMRKEAIEQTLKMLTRIIDATNEARPTDSAKQMEIVSGSKNVINTGNMPGLFGALPQTTTRRFEGAPIPILRMAQLEQTAEVRKLRSLERGAQTQDSSKPLFTERELARRLTPDDLIGVEKYRGSMYDVPLSSKPIYSLQDAPTPAIAAELLQAELTNFANQVGGKALTYLKEGNFYMLYNLQRHFTAEQEAMKAETIYRDIGQALAEKRTSILKDSEITDELTENMILNRNEDYVNLKLELAKAQDNALMVRNEVLSIDGSWAIDVDERVWSVQSMNGESLETVSSGRTYSEAINKTAMDNPRSGNLIAWLAPPAKSPGEVISEFGNKGGIRYADGSNVAMLPKGAHSTDASGPLYMGNQIQVTGWHNALHKILGLADDVSPTSNEITVFRRWADAKARADVDEMNKLKRQYPNYIKDYEDMTSVQLDASLGEGQSKAKKDFRDANKALFYMSKPVIKAQVIENLKAQFGEDFEAKLRERSDLTLEELMTFERKITDEDTIIFVNPLGVVISPHKVVGQAVINLTMQERVLSLNGIQNQTVVDRMRLATMLDRKLPINSEISSRMGGYDPFTKFDGMTIDRARRNTAILTDALEDLQSRSTTHKLSVAVDRRHVIRRGTLSESPMRFIKFSDAINEQGAKEARMILAENTLEVLPLRKTTIDQLYVLKNTTFNKYNEADWANGIQIALMTGKESAWAVFKERVIAEERLNKTKDLDPEDFEKELNERWDKVKDIVNILRDELNVLNKDEGLVGKFISDRNDIFFGSKASDSENHATFISLYSQKLSIERAAQIEVMNRTLIPDNKSFDRTVQFVKPIDDLNGIAARSDGTQMKPNTIDARLRDYPADDGHLMLSYRLDTFVDQGVLNRDQASVLKLAFWDYDTEALNRIFDPMSSGTPIRFSVTESVNYLGKYEQVNKTFTDGVVHRIDLLKNLSSRFKEEGSLGPAAVVLEEIGHALGHRLNTEDQINFIERVRKIEIAEIEEAEKLIYGKATDSEQYKKRLQQLKEDRARMEGDIPENAARRTELFGAMFAISGLHKAKNQWDFISKGLETQEALTDAHATISNLNKLATVAGIEDINSKSLFADVEATLKSAINLEMRMNKRNKPTDDNREVGDDTGPLMVDDITSSLKENEDARRAQLDNEVDEIIEQITDPNTNEIDLNLLHENGTSSITLKDQVIMRAMETNVKRSTMGRRIETPFSDFVAAIAFGKLTNNQIARYNDMLSSPFGMRNMAFAVDGEVPLAAPILHLFNAADSQSYFTSGAFEDAMPTIQALGLYLRGEFEKIIPALAILKGENATQGPLGPSGGETTPWSLFSSLWREMIMDYETPEKAKAIVKQKLASMQGNDDSFKRFINSNKSDEFVDILVQTADSWANPNEGLWPHIVDSMVTAGMVRPEKRDDLVAKAAYPIKFKDSIFQNAVDVDGDTPRRELRRAIVEIVRDKMNNSEDVDVDILQIALADYFPVPSKRREVDVSTWSNRLPMEVRSLLESDEIKGNVNVLLNKIRRGDIKMKDLGTETKRLYDETLIDESLLGKDNPNKQAMLLELSEEFRNKLAKSQQTSTLDLQVTTAAEFVANRYMSNIGSSSYSFAGDAFLSPRQLWEDPRISKFLEDDPVALLDSVKRGTAAQAFDRATYSNYFGIKGFGMKDLIEMYKKVGNGKNTHHEMQMLFMSKDMELDQTRYNLTSDERKKFKAGVDHIDLMYKYSIGTLSSIDNKYGAPFLNILNTISELGTALSIAPRLAIATAIEETPMSIGSVLKDNLLGAKKELQDVLSIAKSTKDIEATLQGLGHVTSSVMHKAAALAAKLGDDGTGSYGATDKKKIKALYKFLSMGMDKQVMAARSLGAMQYIHRVDKLFSNIAGDLGTAKDKDGLEVGITRQGAGGFHVTADELYLQLQNRYDNDFSNITKKNFREFTRELNIDEELSRDVMEMIKAGLFEADKYKYVRNLWIEHRQDILRTGIPFDDLRTKITFDFERKTQEGIDAEGIRARKLQALNGLRELVFVASTKFAKQPSLSTQPLGARHAGALATFFTRLTTYASSSANTLRRAMFAGPSAFAAAFSAHMITGWLYYKLIQLQGFRTIEEMKRELQKDPMGELSDAAMSVPFMGANQMVLSMLIQMMRGERPVNSKPYDIAALNAANNLLQLPVRVTQSVGDIISGDVSKGSANIAQRLPVPHAWALAIALRNAGMFEKDIQIGRLSPNYRGQVTPRSFTQGRPSNRQLPNKEALEQQTVDLKSQYVPQHMDEKTGKTVPSSAESDRVNRLLEELRKRDIN